MDYKLRLPNNFPKKLLDSAEPLKNLGISEIAWKWKDAIEVIEFLYQCDYMILGGDVYKIVNGDLNYTYDSWYVNRDKRRTKDKEMTESRDKSISYITQYHEKNGEDYYYSIVFDKA